MQEDVKRLYMTLIIALGALFVFNKMFPKAEVPEQEIAAPQAEVKKSEPLKQNEIEVEDLKAPALSVENALKGAPSLQDNHRHRPPAWS